VVKESKGGKGNGMGVGNSLIAVCQLESSAFTYWLIEIFQYDYISYGI